MIRAALRAALLCLVALAADDAVVAPQQGATVAPVTNDVVSSNDTITITQMMSYQGRLTDATGVPVPDGNYDVEFRLYPEQAGGNPFWTETQTVTTRDGLFSVLLGSVTPITTRDGDRGPGIEAAYIGMAVEGSEEMTPRLRIAGTYSSPREKDGTTYVPPGGTDVDNAWVRIGADSVLYTLHRLGIVRGESQNKLYGIYGYTQTIFGSSCTTGASGYNVGNISIGGGYGNRAWAPFTAVCGGRNNKAGNEPTDTSAIVVGGYDNRATAKFSAVIGGQNNNASGTFATVGGGESHTASGLYSVVAGGYRNSASGGAATVGGGWVNRARGEYSTIAGGVGDSASGYISTIGGGTGNRATSYAAVVAGGDVNSADGYYSAISGGFHNLASAYGTTVGGGDYNSATESSATVAGGRFDTASGRYSTVSGGFHSRAASRGATVGGGWYNRAEYADFATVSGGDSNWAYDRAATVAGGCGNIAYWPYASIGGGAYNWSRDYGAIPGGRGDTVLAFYGFATNNHSYVGHDNSAAFTGSHTTAPNQIRAQSFSQGTGIFTLDHPAGPLNRILNQYAVGSPELVLMYRGAAVLGADGRAEVTLPDYFEAMNRNPMVQVSGVGTANVYIASDVAGNRFVIGGAPGAKVYWTVTGERKDLAADMTRIFTPVEQEKTGALSGHSLDDDALSGYMEGLEKLGLSADYSFRTAEGRQQYENSKQMLKEHDRGGKK